MAAESALVIAPGRGTYNATELGYLSRWPAKKSQALLDALDAYRSRHDAPAVRDLDAAPRFRPSVHGPGRNAAGLIYACALSDFLAIDRERVDIVAVTGNSMGWYLALAAAGATDPHGSGIHLVEHMARLMDDHGEGGQLVYPLVNNDWIVEPERCEGVEAVLATHSGELFVSIRLGGMVVLAGTEAALKSAEAALPPVSDQYPLRLARHAAFHTPLLADISARALADISVDQFSSPELPLIDGRGEIWQPGSEPAAIRDYTLKTQVLETYDFTRAVEVAVKEFAPDRLIALGPGTGMGAPVLQALAELGWLGLEDRAAWQARQQDDPYVLGMGIAEQRALVAAR